MQTPTQATYRVLEWTSYLLPFVLLVGFVSYFGGNVPMWDQWEYPLLFEKVFQGEATWSDFFEPHNGHRIVLPKVIITFLAFFTNWDIRVELALTLLLAALTFFAIYRLGGQGRGIFSYLAHLITACLIFSWGQYENWLWGFQLMWWLVNAGVVFAIVLLSRVNRQNYLKMVGGATLLCGLVSFSSAHGLVSWIALVVLIGTAPIETSQKVRSGIVWTIGFCLCMGLYSMNYPVSPDQDWGILLGDLGRTGQFFLNILGSPLGHTPNLYPLVVLLALSGFLLLTTLWNRPVSEETDVRQRLRRFGIEGGIALLAVVGMVLLVMSKSGKDDLFPITLIGLFLVINFVGLSIYGIWFASPEFRQSSMPWVVLGGFALGFAGMTTLGRADLGAEQALASRYTTGALWLVVAIVQLWRVCLEAIPSPNNEWRPLLIRRYCMWSGALAILIVVNAQDAFTKAEQWKQKIEIGQQCLEIVHYLNTLAGNYHCLQELYPDRSEVKRRAELLEVVGLRQFSQNIPFVESSGMAPGALERSMVQGNRATLIGWVNRPDKNQSPQIIGIGYEGDSYFVVSAFSHPDVKRTLDDGKTVQTKWGSAFYVASSDRPPLQAWWYDSEQQQFVLIPDPQ